MKELSYFYWQIYSIWRTVSAGTNLAIVYSRDKKYVMNVFLQIEKVYITSHISYLISFPRKKKFIEMYFVI